MVHFGVLCVLDQLSFIVHIVCTMTKKMAG